MLSNSVLLMHVLQTVNFYRGNSLGEDHPTKSIATVSLSVTCAFPSAITLLADESGMFQIFISLLVTASELIIFHMVSAW